MRPSFKTFLLEGLSKILYHSTDISSIEKILKSDTLKLSSTMAKDVEKNYTKKYFYFSTTRSRAGAFHYSHGMQNPLPAKMVLLKLDGQALSSVVGGGPVDYWGRDFRKADPRKHEMEDRITSDKPEIVNAKKYIISAECFFNPEDTWGNSDNYYINPLREIIRLCIEKGIQVNLYMNHKEFIAGKKALQNEEALARVNDHGPEPEKFDRSGRKSWLAPYIELMTTDKKEDLSPEASKILYGFSYTYDFDNAVRRFQADFHNENKTDDSRKLTVLARNAKLRSLRDLMTYIRDKFKKE